MQVMNDGATTQIKEILAHPTRACSVTLPLPTVREEVLDRDPLPQLRSPDRRLLPLAQLLQQAFIGMDGSTAPVGTPKVKPR